MLEASLLCPTHQRSERLRHTVRNYLAQTLVDSVELLILDDSPEPDPFLGAETLEGVRYFHHPEEKISIGSKLNILKNRAKGDFLLRFDDDDYYAPNYVERMLELLGENDFLTLNGWFVYRARDDLFCYWDNTTMWHSHFVVSPGRKLEMVNTAGWDPHWGLDQAYGYGFASIWRKDIAVDFQEWNFGEDADFTRRIAEAGYRVSFAPDREGLVLHIIHETNSSRVFPQYVLPSFVLPKYFPGFSVIGSR